MSVHVAGDHVAETDADATTEEVVTAACTFPDGATPAVDGGASSDDRPDEGGRDPSVDAIMPHPAAPSVDAIMPNPAAASGAASTKDGKGSEPLADEHGGCLQQLAQAEVPALGNRTESYLLATTATAAGAHEAPSDDAHGGGGSSDGDGGSSSGVSVGDALGGAANKPSGADNRHNEPSTPTIHFYRLPRPRAAMMRSWMQRKRTGLAADSDALEARMSSHAGEIGCHDDGAYDSDETLDDPHEGEKQIYARILAEAKEDSLLPFLAFGLEHVLHEGDSYDYIEERFIFANAASALLHFASDDATSNYRWNGVRSLPADSPPDWGQNARTKRVAVAATVGADVAAEDIAAEDIAAEKGGTSDASAEGMVVMEGACEGDSGGGETASRGDDANAATGDHNIATATCDAAIAIIGGVVSSGGDASSVDLDIGYGTDGPAAVELFWFLKRYVMYCE
jgi:hypothetical protein